MQEVTIAFFDFNLQKKQKEQQQQAQQQQAQQQQQQETRQKDKQNDKQSDKITPEQQLSKKQRKLLAKQQVQAIL